MARQSRYFDFIRKQTDSLNKQQYMIAENLAKQQMQPNARGGYNWSQLSKKTEEVAKELFQQQPADSAAPAAPAPQRSAPSPAPSPEVKINKESERLRAEAEEKLAQAETELAAMKDEELQAQKAKELQQRLAITSAANVARGQMQANLQIAPASQAPRTAGTQAFKIRKQRAPMKSAYGSRVNVGQSSTLNV